jgi:hypothetical protein
MESVFEQTTIKAGMTGIYVIVNKTGESFYLTDTELRNMVLARHDGKLASQWIKSRFDIRTVK